MIIGDIITDNNYSNPKTVFLLNYATKTVFNPIGLEVK